MLFPGQHTSQERMVSVIIVSWNAKSYLEQCLASLTASVCRYPMEIIVVDNASTDGSAECVQDRFPYVRLIRNDCNLGFAKANNIGLAHSIGRYVCLVNSDVKLLRDSINRLVDYCEAHSDVGMAGPRVIGGDGILQRSCRGFPSIWNMFCRALALDLFFPGIRAFCGYSLWHWPQETEGEVDILSGCFWLVRREALDQVGVLDESFFMYGEDMDWCLRFWSCGWKLLRRRARRLFLRGGYDIERDGEQDPRHRTSLPRRLQGQERQLVRRQQDLQAHCAAESAGQAVLVAHDLRHPRSPWASTTQRRMPTSRPATKACGRIPTDRSISMSVLRRPRASRRTGCRPLRARRGSPTSGSTARWSPTSTGAGSCPISRRSTRAADASPHEIRDRMPDLVGRRGASILCLLRPPRANFAVALAFARF